MTRLCCVRASLAVAAIFCCCLAPEYQLRVASGCPDPVGDVSGGSAGEGCACGGGEAPSRYVNRTDVIKEEILRKLRMLRPPNATSAAAVSGRQRHIMPDIPLLHSIIQQANDENDNRERNRDENYELDDDDDHVTAITILALSQPGGASLALFIVTSVYRLYEYSVRNSLPYGKW